MQKTIRATEQDRPDVAERHSAWRSWSKQVEPGRLVFIDETWAKTNMNRLRGRAPRGERLMAKTPHEHWRTTTLIGALGIEGMRCATVVDDAVNGDAPAKNGNATHAKRQFTSNRMASPVTVIMFRLLSILKYNASWPPF